MSLSPLEKAIQEKQELIHELDEIYSLVETSLQALQHEIASGDECIADVLRITTYKIFDQTEKEKKALKKLEDEQQGGDE